MSASPSTTPTDTTSNSSNDSLLIQIKELSGTNFSLRVPKSSTIADLMQQISTTRSIDAARQRLIFRGRVLKATDTVEGVQLSEGAVVHLIVRTPEQVAASAADNAAASSASPSTARSTSTYSYPNPPAGATSMHMHPAQQFMTQVVIPEGGQMPDLNAMLQQAMGAAFGGMGQVLGGGGMGPMQAMFGMGGAPPQQQQPPATSGNNNVSSGAAGSSAPAAASSQPSSASSASTATPNAAGANSYQSQQFGIAVISQELQHLQNELNRTPRSAAHSNSNLQNTVPDLVTLLQQYQQFNTQLNTLIAEVTTQLQQTQTSTSTRAAVTDDAQRLGVLLARSSSMMRHIGRMLSAVEQEGTQSTSPLTLNMQWAHHTLVRDYAGQVPPQMGAVMGGPPGMMPAGVQISFGSMPMDGDVGGMAAPPNNTHAAHGHPQQHPMFAQFMPSPANAAASASAGAAPPQPSPTAANSSSDASIAALSAQVNQLRQQQHVLLQQNAELFRRTQHLANPHARPHAHGQPGQPHAHAHGPHAHAHHHSHAAQQQPAPEHTHHHAHAQSAISQPQPPVQPQPQPPPQAQVTTPPSTAASTAAGPTQSTSNSTQAAPALPPGINNMLSGLLQSFTQPSNANGASGNSAAMPNIANLFSSLAGSMNAAAQPAAATTSASQQPHATSEASMTDADDEPTLLQRLMSDTMSVLEPTDLFQLMQRNLTPLNRLHPVWRETVQEEMEHEQLDEAALAQQITQTVLQTLSSNSALRAADVQQQLKPDTNLQQQLQPVVHNTVTPVLRLILSDSNDDSRFAEQVKTLLATAVSVVLGSLKECFTDGSASVNKLVQYLMQQQFSVLARSQPQLQMLAPMISPMLTNMILSMTASAPPAAVLSSASATSSSTDTAMHTTSTSGSVPSQQQHYDWLQHIPDAQRRAEFQQLLDTDAELMRAQGQRQPPSAAYRGEAKDETSNSSGSQASADID